MPFWSQINFQDAASPSMNVLVEFHDHAMLILTLVMTTVSCAFISILVNKLSCRTILNLQEIETIWTILPACILLILAFPSLRLLYLMDEVTEPSLTLKAIGHQWYWSYEYSDYSNLSFDSYMAPVESANDFRLLEVDNRAVLPMSAQIRVLVTAADVIHSWTIPSMGVKVDAVPGRLNQLAFTALRPGVFYGQCSEICGANHSFMPIAIETIKYDLFLKWVKELASNQ